MWQVHLQSKISILISIAQDNLSLLLEDDDSMVPGFGSSTSALEALEIDGGTPAEEVHRVGDGMSTGEDPEFNVDTSIEDALEFGVGTFSSKDRMYQGPPPLMNPHLA